MNATADSALRTAADKQWGFPFGVDGIVPLAEACQLLGGIHVATLHRKVALGLLRKGKHPHGRTSVICRRSLQGYIGSMEV